jgi:hypothetical protein
VRLGPSLTKMRKIGFDPIEVHFRDGVNILLTATKQGMRGTSKPQSRREAGQFVARKAAMRLWQNDCFVYTLFQLQTTRVM